jgi:hypothetical protein
MQGLSLAEPPSHALAGLGAILCVGGAARQTTTEVGH